MVDENIEDSRPAKNNYNIVVGFKQQTFNLENPDKERIPGSENMCVV